MVNFDKLWDLVQKGLKVVETIKESGEEITTSFNAVKNLVFKKKENVTQADMDEAHNILMSELTKFNLELED